MQTGNMGRLPVLMLALNPAWNKTDHDADPTQVRNPMGCHRYGSCRTDVPSLRTREIRQLLPGVNLKTGPAEFYPIERERLAKFDGKTWVQFGKVYGR
jgi:hypothetical protein